MFGKLSFHLEPFCLNVQSRFNIEFLEGFVGFKII